MKYSFLVLLITSVAVAAALGCAKAPVRNAQEGPLSVTWEFNRADRDGEPYTDAVLVITGSNARKHKIGTFYGRVRKILSPAEISPEMVGGTLSGFITANEGRGSEVIVRYNEQNMILIVAERQWNEKLPPGSFRVTRTIPVPEMRQEKTGF